MVVFSSGFDQLRRMPPGSWLAPMIILEASNAARVLDVLGYQTSCGAGRLAGAEEARAFLGRVVVGLALHDVERDLYCYQRLLDLHELALWGAARDCCITWG